MKTYISKSIEDTYKIANEFAKTLIQGDIVLLVGDLGAGKTAFVKGIVKSFGGEQEGVTSPTFTIVNAYDLENFSIFHFDLYRLENPEELYNIGFEEYFYGNGICFIEWPERASDFFDSNAKIVQINKIDEHTREILF